MDIAESHVMLFGDPDSAGDFEERLTEFLTDQFEVVARETWNEISIFGRDWPDGAYVVVFRHYDPVYSVEEVEIGEQTVHRLVNKTMFDIYDRLRAEFMLTHLDATFDPDESFRLLSELKLLRYFPRPSFPSWKRLFSRLTQHPEIGHALCAGFELLEHPETPSRSRLSFLTDRYYEFKSLIGGISRSTDRTGYARDRPNEVVVRVGAREQRINLLPVDTKYYDPRWTKAMFNHRETQKIKEIELTTISSNDRYYTTLFGRLLRRPRAGSDPELAREMKSRQLPWRTTVREVAFFRKKGAYIGARFYYEDHYRLYGRETSDASVYSIPTGWTISGVRVSYNPDRSRVRGLQLLLDDDQISPWLGKETKHQSEFLAGAGTAVIGLEVKGVVVDGVVTEARGMTSQEAVVANRPLWQQLVPFMLSHGYRFYPPTDPKVPFHLDAGFRYLRA